MRGGFSPPGPILPSPAAPHPVKVAYPRSGPGPGGLELGCPGWRGETGGRVGFGSGNPRPARPPVAVRPRWRVHPTFKPNPGRAEDPTPVEPRPVGTGSPGGGTPAVVWSTPPVEAGPFGTGTPGRGSRGSAPTVESRPLGTGTPGGRRTPPARNQGRSRTILASSGASTDPVLEGRSGDLADVRGTAMGRLAMSSLAPAAMIVGPRGCLRPGPAPRGLGPAPRRHPRNWATLTVPKNGRQPRAADGGAGGVGRPSVGQGRPETIRAAPAPVPP